VFCITPDPVIPGTDSRETSEFLPMVARRMVGLYPRLAAVKVRRTWRGAYPQTPDGSPFMGQAGPDGHYIAVGMCGQGFMLGPGAGDLMARLVCGETRPEDMQVLRDFSLDREFAGEEHLK
jgi:sarcosine oxidase subunit beta